MLPFRFLFHLFRLLSGTDRKKRTFAKQNAIVRSILKQRTTATTTWHIRKQTGLRKETVRLRIERTIVITPTNNQKEKSTNKQNKRMQTIRLNSTGAEVATLQQLLNEWGYPIAIDGVFGQKTHVAVCRFQQSQHLAADGCVGQKTWQALQNTEAMAMKELLLKETDFEKAAAFLQVEVAAIKAV